MISFSNAALSIGFGLFLAGTSHAAVLTDFRAPDFVVDYDATIFETITQGANGLYVQGTDGGDTLGGYFSTVDIAGLDKIYLTATVTENPGTYFGVMLFNPDLTSYRTYNAFLEDFEIGISTRVLLTLTEEEGEPFTEVAGFQFLTGGMFSPLALTFEELSAVPEPGTYAAILSFSLCGLLLMRRRQRRAIRV